MDVAIGSRAGVRRKRPRKAAARGAAPAAPPRAAESPPPEVETVSPETLRARWRVAFEAAQSALRAGSLYLPPPVLREHRERLVAERQSTSNLLQAFARNQRAAAPFHHVMHSPGQARRLLGLPSDVAAIVFNLDGVLIGSAALHVRAWTETFDEFLGRRVERTRGKFAPFSPRLDYPRHIHGKTRLEGVRDFLASRGIRLPEGDPSDAPGAETVHGLANRKNAALLRLIEREGLTAFDGARDYLETAHEAGIECAVVSASANTDTILERAGLTNLIDARVDGNVIVAEHLPKRPEPDILLAACDRVGGDPGHTAVFETSPAGITAAATGRFEFVVGVDRTGAQKPLLDAGADLVVSGLDDLLDRQAA
jgi:beta-phosphoglucomutase-like phosphatase (HAD superfamily)